MMNAAHSQETLSHLLDDSIEYRALIRQHHDLDHRLHELTGLPHLSTSEQLEEVTLKKRKLALKDQMEALARSYASRQTAS